jgi:hypothetical protein
VRRTALAVLLALLLGAPRAAPALVPPDPAALLHDVERLASPAMQGRGAGEAGGERAARELAGRLAALGLAPGGDDGFLQWLDVPDGRRAANVIGVLGGRDPRVAHEAVVVGAHYDHEGAPDGVLHPGADDNASGTAVVLEAARAFTRAGGTPRTLVFALFTAEELGLLGSRRYVERPTVPLSRTVAMVNLDMVGRLGHHPLAVLGADSGSGLRALVRETARATGTAVRLRSALWVPSDHLRFDRAGVPVLALFTGQHADQHRPTDTPERIDAAGLARVAAMTTALVARLASDPAPMPGTPGRRPPLGGLALAAALAPAALVVLGAPSIAGDTPAFAAWAAAWGVAVLAPTTAIDLLLPVVDAAGGALGIIALAVALSMPLVVWAGVRVTRLAAESPWLSAGLGGALAGAVVSLALSDRAAQRALASVDEAVLAVIPPAVALAAALARRRRARRRVYSAR